MTIKKRLLAGLLGCTMLAGCDGDDGKNNNKETANLQGTFDQTVKELNGQITQLKQTITAQQGDFDAKIEAAKSGLTVTITRLTGELKDFAGEARGDSGGRYASQKGA